MGKNNTVYLNNSYENIDDFYESVDREYGLDMTPSHQAYVDAIKNNILTIAIGPAGTGKTVLAAKVALDMLTKGEIERIVMTRPIIEVGRSMGYLPGSEEEKMAPWLEILVDAMNEVANPALVKKLIGEGKIVGQPIAFIRGKSFHRQMVLIDEAQALSAHELVTLLTRIGQDSKCVVTGDLKQMDVKPQHSGLIDAINRMHTVKDVAIHQFTIDDVKRSGFTMDVIRQYEMDEKDITPFKFK